ncbi:MAG: c-type cytochrome [Gemmatimonadales bacterium]|nr:c-type cytochrome [Gemmatimonadales bacterium]
MIAGWLALSVLSSTAQIPDSFTNLKVLPRDITRDSLVQIMRGFSLSLSVRCQYCHVGGDGVSFAGVEFAKDDDPHKRKARFMLRMVDSLNRVVLPNIPDLGGRAPLRITCKTCHRNSARPELLTQRLERVRDSLGIEAAVTEYRQLRTDNQFSGRYDFGEWEMNLWAERLARTGRSADAIQVYELNLESFPRSRSILSALGQLHEPTDRAQALEYYRRALELQPGNPVLQRRVERLENP